MMRYLSCVGVISVLIMNSTNVHAETISAIMIQNTKMDIAYTLNDNRTIMEKTWQDVCAVLELPITDVPGGEFCVNPSGNPVYIQPGDLCADGSFKVPTGFGWCKEFIASCPNSSWALSEDKNTCSRPDFSCIINTDAVSEEKLLAAIAYGESSTRDSYKEMAAIAYATIRRRDAAHMPSVNTLIKNKYYRYFTYVTTDGNPRYRKLMCSESGESFYKAYKAAKNALDKGIDYANGGCFWDGYDLKNNKGHSKYKRGFRFTKPEHNIFSTEESLPNKRTIKNKVYYYVFDSTTAHGGTVFWKLNKDYLIAAGAGQCL